MSDLDTYFMCMQGGEPATFKRSLFEEVFSRGAFIPASSHHDIEYADGYTQIDIDNSDEIDGIWFSYMWGDTVIARMLELAVRTNSCILYSDGVPKLIVTDISVVDHIPEDMRDWQVHVVRTPQRYREVLEWGEMNPQEVAIHLAGCAAERAAGTDRPDPLLPFTKTWA